MTMKEKLTGILELSPGAGESDILKAVSELVTEHKNAQETAAFEARVAALIQVTNMPRALAVDTLAEQDAAIVRPSKQLN